jgi:PAS domain S-box-containing protein
MNIRFWPRSIRSQLLIGLVLLEALSLLLFGAILVRQQAQETYSRARQRLEHQSTSVAAQSVEALEDGEPRNISLSVRLMGEAPSVNRAVVSDPNGKIIFSTVRSTESQLMDSGELAQIAKISGDKPHFFALGKENWEAVKPIRFHGQLYGYAWVRTDKGWDREQLNSLRDATIIFGIIWIAASVVLAWFMGRSITRPLAVLQRGTRALMESPEFESQFPLPVTVENEIGDLIRAFNRMFASIEEQRAGLSDTLSLLDSMLANAPIGLAFFDRRGRFVRVNRIFSELTGVPLSRHLGRTLGEVLPSSTAQQLDSAIDGVFEHDRAIRDLEISGSAPGATRPWTWIVSAYPIHTTPEVVRWVGLIVMDSSDRKRSEEALRKTEKLAATGRLAASIAHEINNPLEAITNLLYLLSLSKLDQPMRGYVEMAEFELRRISEITQQTLRFYRQSTLPVRANLSELLDSVLSLHVGRLRNLGIEVERDYDPRIDLYCFAGEIRQVFANLVGNAIDAMPGGGRLIVRARRSRDWSNPSVMGLRFQVADTGSGMPPAVQRRIFEPFFTTKEVTGTGLGLWVSSEIIAKHKGRVRVRSRWDTSKGACGTVFELFFPDSEDILADIDVETPVSTVV